MNTIESQLETWTPELRPPTFENADVAYTVMETAIGRILLARTESGALVASRYVTDDAAEDAVIERLGRGISPRVLRIPRRLDDARRQLEEFLAGRRHEFDLETDLALATPFQRAVLSTLAKTVGYGTRESYGQLAAAIERPKASRAVGMALNANPMCIVVPCHRIVGASGALTGYAGGLEAKRFLLDLEAAA